MSGRPERFFFVHLQKTAGTTLIKRFERHLDESEFYPNDSDGDIVACVISVDHLLERWRERGQEIRFVSGHFPLCTTELLGGDFTTLTVLREPVERTLSYLRHRRKTTPAERDASLEAVYEDSFRFHGLVHNHMVKMFSLTLEEMTDGVLTRVDFTEERLDRAKKRLSGVDVIGLQEHFEEFSADLTHRLGWSLDNPRHMNYTEPCEISDGFRARIAQDNAMDVELYRFAEQLYEERAGAVKDGSDNALGLKRG
jgi:hypothetical protein